MPIGFSCVRPQRFWPDWLRSLTRPRTPTPLRCHGEAITSTYRRRKPTMVTLRLRKTSTTTKATTVTLYLRKATIPALRPARLLIELQLFAPHRLKADLSGALARRPLLTRSGLSYCAQPALNRIGLALAGCLLRALARSSLRRESPFPPCRSYPTRLYRAWRQSRRPFALGHASR
jgi:hypothetical protein